MLHTLTTVDNPYDPFDQPDQWDAWDQQAGYNTSAYLARIVRTSDELSESDKLFLHNQGVESIIENDFMGVYKKVSRPVEHPNQPSKLLREG